MSRDLSRLVNPGSIALFGGGWAENVIVQLQKSGFAGKIWPVHPKREQICGIPCLSDISALPSPPDAAFVGVNRELSIDVIRQLSEMGAGGATCFASGFLESEAETSGGADLQARLIAAAGDMPILGPNCYGLLNYLDGVTLWPDQHGGRPVKNGVAIIGQSSNILINMTMQKRSLPIAYTIAVGNQAQTSMSDIASFMLDDNRVTTLGLYIEGFGDIRDFEAMARKARKLGKSIVAIKSGKSEKSAAATMTHTASLAGNAAASSAFLKRLGIVEVQSVAVFLETLKLLHVHGPLEGNAISSTSCSGGEAGLMSDIVAGTDIHFRELSPGARQKLKDVLGPVVTVDNPLDYHTYIWGDEAKMTATYQAMFEDGFDLSILVMDIPPKDRCDMSAWEKPIESAIQGAIASGGKVAFCTTLPENLSEEISDRLIDNGIVPLHGMEEMVEAVNAGIIAGKISGKEFDPVLLNSQPANESQVLDEANSKSALAQNGMHFPASAMGTSPEEISRASENLSFPLALKGLGIAHKTEAGAVALNLQSPEEVLKAANEMQSVQGFLAEEMVVGSIAEILIGITRDPTGLFLLTIGAGGVLTELLADTRSLLVPADRMEIAEAINALKISNLLGGYRGKPAADTEAIIDAVMAVQAYCIANPGLIELDINPLMALENGAIAVDALIKLEK